MDTEFNGFGGELISLALVSSNNEEFYGVYKIPNNPQPWVKEHVIPYLKWPGLDDSILPDPEFMQKFSLWIYRFRDAEIVADWPADIEHFCKLLTYYGSQMGWRNPANFRFKLIDRLHDYSSEVPHNALSDARALRDYCKDWKI